MSATLPAGFDPRGMRPYFILRDWEGMTTHTIDQFAAAFRVVAFSIRAGHSGDFGEASITIRDDGGAALDRAAPNRPVAVRYGQIIEVHLGRDRASAVAWFLGIIQEPSTESPAPGRRTMTLKAVGYAQRLADRFASVSYAQRRLSDGVSPDPEDSEAYVSAITYHALADTANRDSAATTPRPVLLRRGQTPAGQSTALANRRALAVPSGGLADPGGMAAAHGSAGTRKLLVWDQGTGQSRFRDYDYTPSTGILSGERDLAGTATFAPHRASDRVRCVAAGGGAIVGRVYLGATGNFELRGSYDAETGRASVFTFSSVGTGSPLADAVGLCFVAPNQFVSLDRLGKLRAHPAPAPGGALGAGTVITDATGGSYTVPGSPLAYGALAYRAPYLIVSADGVLYDLRYVPGVGVTDQRTIRGAAANVRGLAYLEGKIITAEDGASSDMLHDYDYDPTVGAEETLAGIEPKIDHLPVLLPDFIRRHQPLSTIVADLAAIGNCVWGVAPDRHFFTRVRGAHDSGILLTNDVGLQLPPPGPGQARPTHESGLDASGIVYAGSAMYVLDKTAKTITALDPATGAELASWALALPAGEIPWGMTGRVDGGFVYLAVATEYYTGQQNPQGQQLWRGYLRRWRASASDGSSVGAAYGSDPFNFPIHQDRSTIDGVAYSYGQDAYFVLRAREIYNAELIAYPAGDADDQNPVETAGATWGTNTGDVWDATGITIGAFLYVLDSAGWVRAYDIPTVPRTGTEASPVLTRRPEREFAVVPGAEGITSDALNAYVSVPRVGIFQYRLADGVLVGSAAAAERAARRSRTTDNWDKSKLCIIRDQPVGYSDTGIGAAYTSLIGLTATRQPRVHAQGEPPNATILLHALGAAGAIAFPFSTHYDRISKLSFILGAAGDISALPGMPVSIVGSSPTLFLPRNVADGPDRFGANIEDVRATVNLSPVDLARWLKDRVGAHVSVPLNNMRVTPGEILWVFVPTYGTADARVGLDYKTGADPNNPLSYYHLWNPGNPGYRGHQYSGFIDRRAGSVAMAVYGAATVSVRAQNTTARRRHPPKEAEYPLRDSPDTGTAVQALAGVMGANGRVVRKYGPLAATPPTHPPPLGATARIIDARTGLDSTVEIAGWTISGSATDPDNLAPNYMGFTVVDRSA